MLEIAKYNPKEDKLILLGDYVDRGPKSKDVIEKIITLRNKYKVIALRGNHDQMMINALIGNDDANWLHNGALSTIQSYCGYNWFDDGLFNYEQYLKAKEFIIKNYRHHIEFLQRLPLYHEDELYIYVHAGLHPLYENWKQQPANNYIWIRDVFFNNPTAPTVNKIVVFGHTPVIDIRDKPDIWFDGDKIGIDGACAYGYQLNALEIREDGYETYFVTKGSN